MTPFSSCRSSTTNSCHSTSMGIGEETHEPGKNSQKDGEPRRVAGRCEAGQELKPTTAPISTPTSQSGTPGTAKPARPPLRFPRELVNHFQRHLHHRLEHQLGNAFA